MFKKNRIVLVFLLFFVIIGLGACSKTKFSSSEPRLVVFASTSCPHCKKAMPELEEKIWDKYNNRVDIFVNVLNGGRFNQDRIKQGTDNNLTFESMTGQKCGFVPSWVIIDGSGKVVDKSCGTEKDINVIDKDLQELIDKN